MKRFLVVLVTAASLLVQGSAWAFAAPMMPLATVEQGMPCHDEGDSVQKVTEASMPCCGEDCACPELCAGQAATVAPMLSYATSAHADSPPGVFADLRLSVNHTQRLRPPIALQS